MGVVDSAHRDHKRYESNLNSLEAIEEQREVYMQQLKAQVNTSVDLYVKSLQALRVRTLKEIDAKFAKSSEENKTQMQRLRSAVTRVNSGLKFGLKALQCHDDTERVAMIGQAMSQLISFPGLPHHQRKKTDSCKARRRVFQIQSPLVVKDLEGTFQTLLQEFKSSDIRVSGVSSFDDRNPCVQLGKKSQLKVTILMQPIGNPQFLIKYGSYYKCSLTPQTILQSDNTWILEFTPCCGGKHAVSACVYGVWTSCSASETIGAPIFYVQGSLKEGDIVRRVPDSDAPVKANETGTVLCTKFGKSLEVQVRWIKGEEEYDESFQFNDPHYYPLELVL